MPCPKHMREKVLSHPFYQRESSFEKRGGCPRMPMTDKQIRLYNNLVSAYHQYQRCFASYMHETGQVIPVAWPIGDVHEIPTATSSSPATISTTSAPSSSISGSFDASPTQPPAIKKRVVLSILEKVWVNIDSSSTWTVPLHLTILVWNHSFQGSQSRFNQSHYRRHVHSPFQETCVEKCCAEWVTWSEKAL